MRFRPSCVCGSFGGSVPRSSQRSQVCASGHALQHFRPHKPAHFCDRGFPECSGRIALISAREKCVRPAWIYSISAFMAEFPVGTIALRASKSMAHRKANRSDRATVVQLTQRAVLRSPFDLIRPSLSTETVRAPIHGVRTAKISRFHHGRIASKRAASGMSGRVVATGTIQRFTTRRTRRTFRLLARNKGVRQARR